jgi:hypothetical protein
MVRHCTLVFATALLLTSLVWSGCTAPRAAIWNTTEDQPSRVASTPTADNAEFQSARAQVELSSAANEVVTFQLAVQALDEPLADAALVVSDLTGPADVLEAASVTVFRMQRVPVPRWPGWHLRYEDRAERDPMPLDVLVPLDAPVGGWPEVLPANEPIHLWFDVLVPHGTPAGTYTGDIRVQHRGTTLSETRISLEVHPFALPDENERPFVVEVDHDALVRQFMISSNMPLSSLAESLRGPQAAQLDGLLRETLRHLRDHRLTPVLRDFAPAITPSARQGIVTDWSRYDPLAQVCLDGTLFRNHLPLEVWPIPIPHAWRAPTSRGLAGAEETDPRLRAYVSQCLQHFAERDWLDRAYLSLPFRKADVSRLDRLIDRYAGMIGQQYHDVRLLVPWCPQDLRPVGWQGYLPPDQTGKVDIWLAPGQFFDPQVMAKARKAGAHTWLAIDRPPFTGTTILGSRPVHIWSLAWQARRLEAEAVHLGVANPWPALREKLTPAACVRAEPTTLLYPGGAFGLPEPVETVRLKHLRRAQQDAAYLAVLDAQGLERVADTVTESMIRFAGADAYHTHFADGRRLGWPDIAQPYELARELLVNTIANVATNAPPADRHAQFVRSAAWRRFLLATRRTDLEVDGTRVYLQGTRSNREAKLECAMTLTNDTQRPLGGTVRFADVPDYWTTDPAGTRVPPIPPLGARRVRLNAIATAIPTDPAGHTHIPLAWSTEDEREVRGEALLSYAIALPTETPPRIDGDLNDWPAGTSNVVGNFTLISDRQDALPGADNPRNATTVFIQRDAEALYLAINCVGSPPVAAPGTVRTNSVVYDDLIPMSDELVEVLIDPVNSGTRSPTDLYHIVVKPSGTIWTERGVDLGIPCGVHEPWAAQVGGRHPHRFRPMDGRAAYPAGFTRTRPHRADRLGLQRYPPGRPEPGVQHVVGRPPQRVRSALLGNLVLP